MHLQPTLDLKNLVQSVSSMPAKTAEQLTLVTIEKITQLSYPNLRHYISLKNIVMRRTNLQNHQISYYHFSAMKQYIYQKISGVD